MQHTRTQFVCFAHSAVPLAPKPLPPQTPTPKHQPPNNNTTQTNQTTRNTKRQNDDNSIPDTVARYGLHWYPDPLKTYDDDSYPAAAAKGATAKDAAAAKDASGSSGRRLLGGAPGGAANYCEKGTQPLFSAYVIYQVHLLIFLLATVHVIYVTVTLMLSLVQVRQWHHWETEAPSADVFLRASGATATPRGLPSGAAKPTRALRRARESAKKLWARVGTNRFTHSLRVALAAVTTDLVVSPVTRTVYYALRLMFIDRLSLDHSFNFSQFLER